MGTTGTSVLAASLCASLAMAQDRTTPPVTTDVGLFARSVGLDYVDGQLWGGGRDFKVLFEPNRFTFTPALGSRAPRNYPLTMRVESFGRGATRNAVGPAKLSTEDLSARYERDDFTETYEIRPEGIKQSFVFDRLPAGSGDLVVRARIDTDLEPERTGHIDENLPFSTDGLGGVDIGVVVGLDGEGRQVQGAMRYEAGILEMSLPAAFVDQATLPLVLDPVIGPNIWIRTGTEENFRPDVAYDDTNDLYLVVFERRLSQTDRDIHGQRVNGDGTLNGGLLFIEPGSAYDDTDASVAGINVRDSFVVVYQRSDNIIGRAIDAATGARSSPILVASHTDVEVNPDLGGEIGLQDDVICVWRNVTSNRIQAQRVQVDAAGVLSTQGPVVDLAVSGATTLSSPRIAKSGGSTGVYLVVYQTANSSQTAIGGRVIDRTLNILANTTITATAALERLADVDGDGRHWVVAWQARPGPGTGDYDVYARTAYYDHNMGDAVLGVPRVIAGQTGVDELNASVARVSHGTCLVGWQALVGTPENWDVYVRAVDLFNCLDCEGQFTVANGAAGEAVLVMAGQRSGGSLGEEALLVWQESSRFVPPIYIGDIKARRWSSEDGIHSYASTRICGAGGLNYATCARVGNSNFTPQVRFAAPSAATWLIVGFDRLNLPCGPCTLVPNPWTGFVVTGRGTGVRGHAFRQIPIPNAPSLAGLTFFTQWLVAGTGCPMFNSNLSNALTVRIQ